MTELNDNHLRPPGILEQPVAECAVCGAELYESQDAYTVFDRQFGSALTCSTSCALNYFDVAMVTLGDDAN